MNKYVKGPREVVEAQTKLTKNMLSLNHKLGETLGLQQYNTE